MKTLAVTLKLDGIIAETERSFGINFGSSKKGRAIVDFWFPKSQCTIENGILRVPEWLAKKNQMTAWAKFDGCWWEKDNG